MEFWKKNKWKIIAPVLIVLVLAVAFVFGDKNIPEQKDPTEQPGISAPAQPTQDDEMPEEPDDTATPEDTETATEDVPAPSNEQTADEAEKVDIDRSEFMTPEEMGAGATGEYEEVNGMMIDTGGKACAARTGGRGAWHRRMDLHALHFLRHDFG